MRRWDRGEGRKEGGRIGEKKKRHKSKTSSHACELLYLLGSTVEPAKVKHPVGTSLGPTVGQFHARMSEECASLLPNHSHYI